MAYYFNNGKYHNSIFYFIASILKNSPALVSVIKYTIYAIFVSLYAVTIIKLLKKPQIDFSETIKKYHLLLMIFVLLIITNFYLWYLIWVFPTVFWLDKKQIKDVIYLGLGGQIAFQCTFMYIGEYDFQIIVLDDNYRNAEPIVKVINKMLEKYGQNLDCRFVKANRAIYRI